MFNMRNAKIGLNNTNINNDNHNQKVITTTKTKPLNSKSRFTMF